MPGPDGLGGVGSDSGGSPQPTGSGAGGAIVVQDVLSTEAGTMAGAGAAVQLFATPKPHRNTVFIANSGGTGAMYVGFTSDVSSTKNAYKVAAGANLSLSLSPQVNVWVRPDATGNSYTAHEMRIK